MDFGKIARRLNIVVLLNSLAEQRTLDKITVDEICTAAQISRSTFYRTFDDIYSIPLWCQDLFFLAGEREIGRSYTWRDGLYVALSGLDLLRPMMMAVQRTGYRSNQRTGQRHAAYLIEETLRDKGIAIDVDLRFQIDFYSEMETHTVGHWIHDGLEMPCADLADKLASCIPGKLKAAVDIPQSTAEAKAVDFVQLIRIAQEFDPETYFPA